MTSLRKFLISSVLTGAFVVSGCGSTTKSSTGSESTTTTSSTTTTVSGDSTSTSAASTTTPSTAAPTTAAPVVATTTPATTPATSPQIITSFSVSDAAACTDPSAPYQPPPPSVTVSWTVVGADSVNLLIDGGLWGSYGLSGSESLPASCDGSLHNKHTYSVVAMKNGQQIAKKSATRGY